MKTECSECKAPMPTMSKSDLMHLRLNGVSQGYCCKVCGHWNNLKRRRGFAAWREKQMEAK